MDSWGWTFAEKRQTGSQEVIPWLSLKHLPYLEKPNRLFVTGCPQGFFLNLDTCGVVYIGY